jgi:hypothetical protein
MFFDNSRPDRRKRAEKKIGGAERLRQLASSPVPDAKSYELFGLDEILHGGRTLIFDVESYRNYWLVSFKCDETGKIIYFEDTPGGYFVNGYSVTFDVWQSYLTYILYRNLIVGFNSRSYDLPVVLVAIQGARADKLKDVSDDIIREEMQPYQIERKYGVKALHVNHIDLIGVAPIQASLKIYSGRMHCERMQDLPFEVDAELSPIQAAIVRDYNINDLDNTQALYHHLKAFIGMRIELGQEYNQDLRSKSDAQIAEAVIVTELENLGPLGKKPDWQPGDQFFYKVPEWLSFKTPQFQRVLEVVATTPFVIGNSGSASCPQAIADLKPRLGNSVYRLGIGGLHTSEESVFYRANDDVYLIDRDVASYYPYIILNNRLFPEHLGEAFLEVYRNLVLRRLALKKAKNPLEAGLKIAINGTFGKLGNFYSDIYSPDLLTQVTMTGQLALMMQIEMVELAGISCISANTDGAVYRCPKSSYEDLENVITIWEGRTGFVTEETRYSALYSRDVNNYIAVKELQEGKNTPEIKTKGVYCERGSAQNSVLSKNPDALICSEAVQQFLANDVPLEQTVRECKDIRKFVSVRTVKGGGEKNGVYLGKAVRWYYAAGETGTINYALSGNKVPKSEGARPLMILPPSLPDDIDFDRYVNDAIDILFDLGFYRRPEAVKLF